MKWLFHLSNKDQVIRNVFCAGPAVLLDQRPISRSHATHRALQRINITANHPPSRPLSQPVPLRRRTNFPAAVSSRSRPLKQPPRWAAARRTIRSKMRHTLHAATLPPCLPAWLRFPTTPDHDHAPPPTHTSPRRPAAPSSAHQPCRQHHPPELQSNPLRLSGAWEEPLATKGSRTPPSYSRRRASHGSSQLPVGSGSTAYWTSDGLPRYRSR